MSLIVPRSVWGSKFDYVKRHAEKPADPRKVETCLHHTATVAPDLVEPWDDEYAAMRQLEQIGIDRFQSGISYNVLVVPSGNAYEGQPLDNKATHSAYSDWNYTRASISLVGNYETKVPTEEMLRTVAQIQAMWLANGTITKVDLRAHGDVQATECPGANVRTRLADIEMWARALDSWARDLEGDMALFETETQFRNAVRVATEAELNEQRPLIVADVVAAVVAAIKPLIPAPAEPLDTAALVAQVVAAMEARDATRTYVVTNSYQVKVENQP